MILPNKYISIEDSFIGISARILNIIKNKSYSIDTIWNKLNNLYNKNKLNINFKKFSDVISFMYIVNMINFDKEGGVLYNENIVPENN